MGMNKRDPATGWNPVLSGIADRVTQNGVADKGGIGGAFARGIIQGWQDKGLVPSADQQRQGIGWKTQNSQSGMWAPGVTSTDRKMAVLQSQWANKGYLPQNYQPVGQIPIPGYGAAPQQQEAEPQQIDPRVAQLLRLRGQLGQSPFRRF